MKRMNVIIGFCLILMGVAFPLQAGRIVKTINDCWDFRFPDQSEWTRVAIPHTFNEDAYKTRDYYKGKGIYRKNISLNEIMPDRRYYIKFDAANKVADVSVNNRPMMSHAAGYTAFIVDVTDNLVPGNNELIVSVDNSRQDVGPISADFTFWGGIYRDTWLISTHQLHFDMLDFGSNGVAVTVSQVDSKRATVKIVSGVTNDSPSPAVIILRNTLFAPDGDVVASSDKKVKVPSMQTVKIEDNINKVSEPKLWSPKSPDLYTVKTEITSAQSGEKLDEIVNKIGFRWFEFDGEKGFFLNGKHVKLRGVNRHQDMAPLGWALSDAAHRKDFEYIKEMGANFVRLAHYPQDDAVLDECDRLGLLVWEEIPVINRVDSTPGFDKNAEISLVEMIRQHRNHPSVIGWGYMNEILLRAPGENDKSWQGVRDHTLSLAHRLEKVLKEEDDSRVSFTAFHGSDRYNKEGLNITDVTGWNLYQGWYGGDLSEFDRYLENQHKRFPEKPIIVSEWGAGSDRRLHSLRPVPFDFSIEYQQKYVEHYLPYIENHDFISGGAYWNFIDFNVAERQESMPRVNNKGLLYNNRDWKDVAYYFKSAWRDDIPVLHIAVRDWEERVVNDGERMPIKVYGNVDEVELYVNGVFVGKKSMDNFNCIFDVDFYQGKSTITARAIKNGAVIEDVAVVNIRNYPDILAGELLAVNVGSDCAFTSDFDHLTWLPDRNYSETGWGYIGGDTKSTTSEIFNTVDGPVYQTYREGISEYRFDVPAGRYEVELLMTDVNRPSSGSPYLLGRNDLEVHVGDTRMNIVIDGETYESDFSPADADNYFQPVCKRYMVNNDDGQIAIKFIPIAGKASLSGITIKKL